MTALATEAPVAPATLLDVTVNSTDLVESLKFIIGAVPTRSRLPILNGVRITGHADGVELAAFDYEVSATETIAGTGTIDGVALVGAKLLFEIAKGLDKNAPVHLTGTNPQDVLVESNGVEYTLKTLPIDEYPSLPVPAPEAMATFSGSVLAEMLRVAVAAGRDDTLPVLTGVCFAEHDGVLEVAATDRYRLTVLDTGVAVTGLEGRRVLVPASSIAIAAKHLAKAEQVTLGHSQTCSDDGYITLSAGTRTMTARVLLGEFPKYRSLLPDRHESELSISAKELSKAVARVGIVTTRTSPVRLTVGGEDTIVEAGGLDEAFGKATVKGTTYEGEPLTIAFNPMYLLDGAKAIGTDVIHCGFVSPTKPAVWYDRENPRFKYLLMPVRLAG